MVDLFWTTISPPSQRIPSLTMATVFTYCVDTSLHCLVYISAHSEEGVSQSLWSPIFKNLQYPNTRIRLVLLAADGRSDWRRGLSPIADEWLMEFINFRQVRGY